MNNIAWLESIASMTDYDLKIDEVLNKQSADIQMAYRSNNQAALKALLGGTDRLACKNTIFQL